MKIEKNVSFSKLTTFRIGGEAKFFAKVSSIEDLKEVVNFARIEKLPTFILGQGSNILVSDSGFSGMVIQMAIGGIKYDDKNSKDGGSYVYAGAGVIWDDLVQETVSEGFYGLENLSGIPGTVGAAPVQNIGAYGSEIKDTLESVEVFDAKILETRQLSKEECQFSYRDSIFKRKENSHLVITRVTLKLHKNISINISYADLQKYFADHKAEKKNEITASQVREAVLKIRKEKLPDIKEVGTAGSFFKNPVIPKEKFLDLQKKFPGLVSFRASAGYGAGSGDENKVKISAAWIIDKVCGLKGFKEGNVGTWEKQPLAIVNYGNATSRDVSDLANMIEKTVKEKTGINLEWEVQLV